MFVDQLDGLPKDDELEKEIEAASAEPSTPAEPKPELGARFRQNSSNWK
jgi:hypothetical protein